MYEKTALCNKINEIYPEIGECDKDLKVVWDSERNVWEVNFKKGCLKQIVILILSDCCSTLYLNPAIFRASLSAVKIAPSKS